MAVVDLIGPVLREYSEQAVAVLSSAGRPVSRVIPTQPGTAAAWDDCCDGQLWVRLVQVQAAVSPPKADGTPCTPLYWLVTAAMGVVRCAHVLDENGVAPSAVLVAEDGQEMLDDLQELQQVLICNGRTVMPGPWRPLGVSGGCHGGEWQFTFRVEVCGC